MAAALATSLPDDEQQQQQATGYSRWVPSLPTINLNQLNPFANAIDNGARSSSSTDPTKQQPQDGPKPSSVNKRSFLSTTGLFGTSNNTPEPPSRDASPARSATMMFAEPDTRSTSEDGDSREGSVMESQRRSSKKSNKPKTRFSVCHAPPGGTVKQKLHRRPRSLLQLHRLSGNARPVPAFEVIPSANFSVRLTRAVTKVFKAKHGLCLNDLVVLRAEKYVTVDDEREEEEQAARDVIGLICAGRKQEENPASQGKAKICMTSGAEWEAYPLMNGGYEFFSTDEHGLGLTVRWVPKRNKEGSKAAKDGSKKFNFSTISPNSRRHPVIASLSKTALEVNDTYRMPDPSAPTPLSTPKQNSTSALAEAMDEEAAGGKEQCETDAALREIISMTAIWVTFKEGWSPTFKYDDSRDVAQRVTSTSVPNSPSKSMGSVLATPPGSPAQGPQLEKKGSIKSVGSSILRRGSMLSKGNRASQISVPEEDMTMGRSESVKKTGRARGDSTSTVLVHRAASNRRKNNQQATWRPDLLSAQNPLNETSREDLNGTPPRASTQRPEQWDSPATPPQRRQSVLAEPLIPASPSGMDTPTGAITPTPTAVRDTGAATPTRESRRANSPEKPAEKRISDATTETTEASYRAPSVGQKAAANLSAKSSSGKAKKKGGWRRLLCGSGHHDL